MFLMKGIRERIKINHDITSVLSLLGKNYKITIAHFK